MLFHVGAVAALFYFTWSGLFAAIFLHWVMGGLGLGVCYHRLLTHRSPTRHPSGLSTFSRFAA
jgi:fatty-acid desaturase